MTKPIPIPIAAAQRIAEDYGYDQVVVMARKCGPDGMEHVTTYGVDKAHCGVAAQMGYTLKHRIMDWPERNAEPTETKLTPNAELRGAKPIGGASRSNDVLEGKETT